MILVSVIIPTRNRAALLQNAIESVLAVQRHDFDLEVIVVDDGSTDNTASTVSQYPVSYVQTAGLGASGARNTGITIARGDFIAFLDDDDVWLPTNITPQLKAFAANPTYGAVHGQVIFTGPDRTPWGAPTPPGPLSSGWIFHDLLDYWPQVASLLVRRSVLDDVGLFDVTLRAEEDWDLILRIAWRYPIGRVEEPLALFRQRDDDDDIYFYRCLPDTVKVFHRHTRREPLPRRLLLQRRLWRHRGWYAAQFVGRAQAHVDRGEHRRAWRSLSYALQASPPHALLTQPALWRSMAKCMASVARFPALS